MSVLEGRPPRSDSSPVVVGREAELTALQRALDQATSGRASAVLVSGAPGVGKTALVQSVLGRRSGPDQPRLVIRCLPLHSLIAGLGPLRTAIQHSSASPAVIRACLQRFDTDPLRALDDWVDDVTTQAPVVVFVDDVQWADARLRDVLHYLLAGPPERRVAVLLTARTSGLPDGDPLHAWLAELLRLPLVTRLDVAGLSRSATATQLSDLLGAMPHQSLVDEVFGASRGNPYLTSLLARGLGPADQHLPAAYPRDLVAAVTGVWHGCAPETRTVTCLLAVAGTPHAAAALAETAAELGLTMDLAAALAEAEAAGLLEQTGDGRLWFRHPLQAEVLEGMMPAAQRRRLHAAFARLADQHDGYEDDDAPQSSLELALHQAARYDRAGSPAVAYDWAMRAWERRGDGQPSVELRRVLRRAVAQGSHHSGAAEEPAELWQRLRLLAAEAAAFTEELEAVDALIALTDPDLAPLELSELLVRRMLLRMVTATGFCSVPDMERAVELAAADPSSWQYALARAELAHAASWQDDPRATELARLALLAARAAGHPTALSLALTASSMTVLTAGDHATAERLAGEAADLALASRDWWSAVHAILWESNAMPGRYGLADVVHFARRRRQLTDLGAPTAYVLQITAVEAGLTLELGDAQACADLLRDSLVCDPGPMADLRARLALAQAAAYQGRTGEAMAHIDRARELIARPLQLPNLSLDATWATVLLAANRPAEAYQVAVTAAGSAGLPVDMVERLLPLAARALADQQQAGRVLSLSKHLPWLPEERRADSPVLTTLNDLRARFPRVISEPGVAIDIGRHQLEAMQAWYDAETARARRDSDEVDRWLRLREGCDRGHLPWLEAYACWRAAEALLSRGHGGRAEGTRMLKAGYVLAVRLGAEGIRSELADLARLAHVVLVKAEVQPSADDPLLADLTTREREIVALLCTGPTYAEIAATLVISEKTVSSHVSNILRKTGTSSRVELTRQLGRDRPV